MNAHPTGARRVCLRAQLADIPEGGVRALPMIRAGVASTLAPRIEFDRRVCRATI